MRRYGYRGVRFATEEDMVEVGKRIDGLKGQTGVMSTWLTKAVSAVSACQALYKRGDYSGAARKADEATKALWDIQQTVHSTVGSFGFAYKLPEMIQQIAKR